MRWQWLAVCGLLSIIISIFGSTTLTMAQTAKTETPIATQWVLEGARNQAQRDTITIRAGSWSSWQASLIQVPEVKSTLALGSIVIAKHSPKRVLETGLLMEGLEKNRWVWGISVLR
jgi:hypothetical protein